MVLIVVGFSLLDTAQQFPSAQGGLVYLPNALSVFLYAKIHFTSES
jgi:hypothetical protein